MLLLFNIIGGVIKHHQCQHHKHQLYRRISIAIVGSGPSGFYTAKYLKKLPQGNDIEIDMFERLPTPFGLVRSGVAPDHPEVKNVENDFVDVARSGNFNFFGNVTIGKDLQLDELRDTYDAVVLAYGCSSDNRLPSYVSGSDLKGIISAREFVAWYNGHPDFAFMTEEINDILGICVGEEKNVVIIGQGNVALDCARILAKVGISSDLCRTDIAQHFIDSPPMKYGKVKKISIIGRRGHHQGAFTIRELRELTKLKDTRFIIRQDELDLGSTPASMKEIENSRPRKRIDKLLQDSVKDHSTNRTNVSNEVYLRFLMNPIKFVSKPDDILRVGSVVCERTVLVGNPDCQVAKGTGQNEIIDADLVLTSIGYRGECIPGFESSFDESKGIAIHDNGRCTKSGNCLYVSGWLKRGPSGIIGTNIADAKETVASIAHDYENGILNEKNSRGQATNEILSLLNVRGIHSIDWNAYDKIDQAEKNLERLRDPSQPRQKIVSVEEMLKIL